MAKKKKPTISLEGLDDVVFDKKPDISSAQSILNSQKERKDNSAESASPTPVESVEAEMNIPEPQVKEIKTPVPARPVAEKSVAPKKNKTRIFEEAENPAKGTLPPEDKKRASFNIPKDLHRAIKDYSYFNEVDMVEYIFEQLVKPDLEKKGYYPPKKRRP